MKKIAKEYLESLRDLDKKIEQDLERVLEMRNRASAIQSFDYTRDRVKSSGNNDPIGNTVSAYADIERRINEEIDQFIDMREKIVHEIRKVKDFKKSDLLYKFYVQYENYKTLESVADAMGYSYEYVRRLHIEALNEFVKMNPAINM